MQTQAIHPHHPASEELLPTDPLTLVETPAAQRALEWPPREIIRRILGWLSKPDLLNVRLVNRELGELAIPLLTDVRIPGNIPSEAQAERFFQDFTTKLWRGKKPSEAFINLFRHAPLKELNLGSVDI
ncbi:MAG: F-box protein [Alphaproteobacteria bacterium]